MSWNANDESQLLYAQLIATIVRKEGLRPFDRTAVARVIDYSARLVSDSERLSARMQSIVDLLEEADHWAGESDVLRDHGRTGPAGHRRQDLPL